MLFWSKYAAFRKNVRPKIEVMHPTLPRVLQTIEPLVAEFAGVLGAEQRVDTPDGSIVVADISGHYFDSVTAQEQNGWTDDEREEVEQALLDTFRRIPAYGHLVTVPKSARPWPTYDDTPRDKIVETAVMLGLVGETLAYEGENKARSTVTGPLQDIVDRETAELLAEDALDGGMTKKQDKPQGHIVTLTVELATDVKLLADRAADELAAKVEEIELTVDGVTSHLHHSVTGVKVAAK